MKNFTLLFTSILLISNHSAFSQSIEEQDRPMSLGVKHAFVVKSGYADYKESKKIWEDQMKDLGLRLKTNRKADELYAMDAELSSISNGNRINFYSRLDETADMPELIVWVDLGMNFLTSEEDPESTESLRMIMRDFQKRTRVAKQNQILDEEKEVLDNIQKDFDKLIKDKEDYEKEIQKAKEEIAENEKNIEVNLGDQEKVKAKIENQQAKLEEIKEKIKAIQAE